MATSPSVILAYTAEDDRYHAVREAAEEAARASEARLILYDIDAAGLFASPTPTEWDGDGQAERYPHLLLPDDLESAGRHAIAEQVAHARRAGIDAYGWLPASKGAGGVADYAGEQGVDLILLPEDMEAPGLLDRLRGVSIEKVVDKAAAGVAVVRDDGDVTYQQPGPDDRPG